MFYNFFFYFSLACALFLCDRCLWDVALLSIFTMVHSWYCRWYRCLQHQPVALEVRHRGETVEAISIKCNQPINKVKWVNKNQAKCPLTDAQTQKEETRSPNGTCGWAGCQTNSESYVLQSMKKLFFKSSNQWKINSDKRFPVFVVNDFCTENLTHPSNFFMAAYLYSRDNFSSQN